MVFAPENAYLCAPMINSEPKYDFSRGQYWQFNKFMAHINTFFNPQIAQNNTK